MPTTACRFCALVVLALCVGLGHGLQPGADGLHTNRKLQQFRPVNVFPYTRCGNLSSKGQPYYIFGPDVSTDGQGVATYTFGLGYKGRSNITFPCYSTLEQSLYKLMISIYAECMPALKVAGMWANITQGNRTTLRAMHVYQYPEGANLSISKLGLNKTSVDGVLVSFRAAAPCNAPGYLFRPNTNKKVPIEYALTESSAHKCCGRSV